MAKLDIETKDGTKITVDGTPEEVSKILAMYKEPTAQDNQESFKKFKKPAQGARPTITDVIRGLVAEGFFDKPKTLAEIKTELEQQGYFIPITSLSPRVLSLTQNRELRRIKQEGKWAYARW